MQFAVPQFTDVEDKLIGPLTLKQFLIILATGAVIMFFYSILKLSVFFFFFAVPISLAGLAIAFGRFNGRPLYGYIPAFISYLSKPQVRIFRREEVVVNMSFKTVKKTEPLVQKKSLDEPRESRLRKLAYLLDKQTEEETQLVNKKI
ncbi:MAG: PrgI family protein [Candidatus Doudnabacteria bacterium]|nr:PrgI family protein [Candidatus Doudnabacteria bacterium]